MFRYDEEERPASPLVEWWRWSKRNTTELQSWKRLVMPMLIGMAVLYLVFSLSKPELVADKLFGLALTFVISAVVVPACKLLGNMVRAPYGILREHTYAYESAPVITRKKKAAKKR